MLSFFSLSIQIKAKAAEEYLIGEPASDNEHPDDTKPPLHHASSLPFSAPSTPLPPAAPPTFPSVSLASGNSGPPPPPPLLSTAPQQPERMSVPSASSAAPQSTSALSPSSSTASGDKDEARRQAKQAARAALKKAQASHEVLRSEDLSLSQTPRASDSSASAFAFTPTASVADNATPQPASVSATVPLESPLLSPSPVADNDSGGKDEVASKEQTREEARRQAKQAARQALKKAQASDESVDAGVTRDRDSSVSVPSVQVLGVGLMADVASDLRESAVDSACKSWIGCVFSDRGCDFWKGWKLSFYIFDIFSKILIFLTACIYFYV